MNPVAYEERGLVFPCGENRLVGIAAIPQQCSDTGVILLVGGPQYRVGSHRQFTLLARSLAEAGIPSLRFDYTGMGDSEGPQREFSETNEDLQSAIEQFCGVVPNVSRIVLWGLCDAASSAMMFAHRHPLVQGLVLLNPWVHGTEHSPEVKLSHYYRPLLTGRENWRRLFSGKIKVLPAIREFAGSSLKMVAGKLGSAAGKASRHAYVQQMQRGFRDFGHPSLVILSDDDLTAHEFSNLLATDWDWQALMSKVDVTLHTVSGADHTFSNHLWQDEVARLTIDWVGSLHR